ncbi:MAG: putative membrane protein YdbT with pleckstrin-like domain [Candidatus Woesearchaeota archaeon]|jgi:uncharacterized membrane protein YdbT with pleckstrin-like domain
MTSYKPLKKAFFASVYLFLIPFSFVALIFIIPALIFVFPLGILMSLGLIGICFLFMFPMHAAYRKTNYEFKDDRIIYKTGGPFSDSTTELLYKNVTHISMIRPFILNKLFNVGHIYIHSAGSAGAEIRMSFMEQPQQWFAFVQKQLQGTFSLQKKKTIYDAKPSISYAFASQLIGMVIALCFILPAAGTGIFSLFIASPLFGVLSLLAACILLLLFAAAPMYFTYKDYQQRSYTVYDDSIEYHEGFLTKHDTIIPAENLTDASSNQTIFMRLFGVSNVTTSCQGSSSEITFAFLKDPDSIQSAVKQIAAKNKIESEETSKKTETTSTKRSVATQVVKKTFGDDLELKPNFFRSIIASVSSLILIIPLIIIGFFFPVSFTVLGFLIIVIFGAIAKKLSLFFTTYKITPDSVTSEYNFLQKKSTTFSEDKITMATVTRNPFDRMCSTVTLSLASIGGSSQLVLKHVRCSQPVIDQILSQLEIDTSTRVKTITPTIRFIDYLKEGIIGGLFWTGIIVIVSVLGLIFKPLVAVIAIGIWLFFFVLSCLVYLISKWSMKVAIVRLYEEALYARVGRIFVKEEYAKRSFIKGVRTSRIPFSTTGSLVCDVAGESIVQTQQQGAQQSMSVSHRISASYLLDVSELEFDKDLFEYTNQKTSHTAKPQFRNSAFPFIFMTGVFTAAGAVGFAASIGVGVGTIILGCLLGCLLTILGYISVKRKTYELQDDRIVVTSGIFRKVAHIIPYERIDHLNVSQSMFGKIFKNGSVLIYTAGSGSLEMSLSPIKEYKEFGDKIKQEYER